MDDSVETTLNMLILMEEGIPHGAGQGGSEFS